MQTAVGKPDQLLAEVAATVDGWATNARLDRSPASPESMRSDPARTVGFAIEL